MKPCGTHAAYQRHKRRGENACSACLAAEREYQGSRRAPYVHTPVNLGKPCLICGAGLGKGKQRYCSKACARTAFKQSDAYRRAQAARNSKPRRKVERTCERCKVAWLTDASGHARFCSIACAKAGTRRVRDIVRVGPPDFCWLPPTHPAIRWADRLPLPVSHSGKWWTVVVQGKCAWCAENFTSLSTTGTDCYCSRRCARNMSKSKRGWFQIPPTQRVAIYARDQWTCQLCMEPVDQDLMVTDPYQDWAPSLDHVIPQSKGGSHDAANLRLAHRWCNAVRGAEDYHADLFAVA